MMFSNIDSYTTPMKRSKVGGAAMDNEAKEALKVMKTDTPVILTSARSYGEKKKYSSHSVIRSRGTGSLTMKQITDILCPIFSYKRVGYGNNWYLRKHSHYGTAGDFMKSTGSVKSISWPAGKQGWAEFVGLPMHNFGGQIVNHGGVFTYDGFHASVSQLIAKAADIRNDVQSTHITRPTGTLTEINSLEPITADTTVLPKDLRQWKGLAFDYLGGYQEHTFINVSEAHVTVYIQEAQPREVMSGLLQLAGGTLWETDSIGRNLLEDYKMDLPLANTLHPTYTPFNNNNRATDQCEDVGVKIKASSNTVHRKYHVSKEVKVVLAPGDIYTHKMAFDPFSFMESTWNILSSTNTVRQSTTNSTTSAPPVMLVPMFTKILIVRASSELGITANRDNDTVSGVGNVGGCLAHTCTEKHSCRMLPYQAPYQSFYENNLAGTDNAVHLGVSVTGASETMNVETNTLETINPVTGLAI